MRPSGDVKNKVSLLGGVVTSHEVKSGQWCGSGFHMRRAASHVPKQNGAVANFPQGKTYATPQMLIIKLFNTTTRTEYRRTIKGCTQDVTAWLCCNNPAAVILFHCSPITTSTIMLCLYTVLNRHKRFSNISFIRYCYI